LNQVDRTGARTDGGAQLGPQGELRVDRGPLLRMEGISKSFFGVQVLQQVDFDLFHGEVHALLGENGAGKSTLMKILSGAYRLDSGSISLDGQTLDLSAYDPRVAENLGVVTIYQNFHLIPHLSVAENLAMPLFTHGRGLIRWKDVYAHAGEALNNVHYDIDPRAKVRDLPISQKQMLEIAIALSKNARVIIMDEPTAALSRNETEILFDAIADIKARGIGIIYISHKLEEVKQIGDRITVLRNGAQVGMVDAKDLDLDLLVKMMIGKDLSSTQRSRALLSEDELFRVEGLLSDHLSAPISFAVRRHEILGVTGLVGSGKSELARALFGVDRLTGGAAYLSGQPVHLNSPHKAVSLGIGYLPEDRDSDGLCLNLGVKENISMVLLAKLKGLLFNTASERNTVSRVVESMDIKTAGLSQKVKYLSGGNKQKVVFGKWLSAGCNLLILDEPTIGIDVGARSEIYDLIREFVAGGQDRAVIFISSDIAEILDIAGRILVMSRGCLVAEVDSRHTSKQELMQLSLAVPGAPQDLAETSRAS
jgi:ribose transport system ATP-binding protein